MLSLRGRPGQANPIVHRGPQMHATHGGVGAEDALPGTSRRWRGSTAAVRNVEVSGTTRAAVARVAK